MARRSALPLPLPMPRVVRSAMAELDFERDGLLDGLDRNGRRVRVALLQQLAEEGVTPEEMVTAKQQNRLGLLLLERTLSPHGRYTEADIAESAGLEPEVLRRWFRALGRPGGPATDAVYRDADVDLARRLADYLALGIPEDGMLTVARTIGRGLSSMADAIGALIGEALLQVDGEPDGEEALRYAAEVRRLAENDAHLLTHILATSLADRIGSHAVTAAERGGQRLQGTREVAVCFADLVGFTALGEQLGADVLGRLADDFAALVTDVVEPPVRLVKTIGDAVMLVSPDPRALVFTALNLLDARCEHVAMPALRIGIALGAGVPHGGDWYGPAVNLASRITANARPDTVLTTEAVRGAAGDGALRWHSAGSTRFKGVRGSQRLWRVQRVDEISAAPPTGGRFDHR